MFVAFGALYIALHASMHVARAVSATCGACCTVVNLIVLIIIHSNALILAHCLRVSSTIGDPNSKKISSFTCLTFFGSKGLLYNNASLYFLILFVTATTVNNCFSG